MGCIGLGRAASLSLMPSEVCPLESLNNDNRFDLLDSLDIAYGNSNDSNPYIENIPNTTYFDPNSIIPCMRSPSSNIFISLNIRSLMCNHEQLSLLLSNLISKNLNIVAVALQEVWSVPYPDSVKIPGFNLILNTRKNSRGGWGGFLP